MQLQTDFKLAGPLAGLFGGITQAQEQERQGLSNAYQMLKNQEQEYTSAEAQAKMNDPQYIQMKLQNDMSKFGKETSLNEIESAYNKANRAVAHLKAAQAMGPQALQQASLQYLQEMGIDPASEKGQMLLKDPVGNAEKLSQFYATAATNNSEYMRQYGLQEQKDTAAKERTGMEITGREKVAGINASAQRYAADAGAASRDTNALITEEKNYRTAVSQHDTVIEKYKRGEMDAEIISNIRKQDPKKSEAQAKSEAKVQRDKIVSDLQTSRDNLSRKADEYGDAVSGRMKLGQKAPANSGGSTPPPPSGYKPI